MLSRVELVKRYVEYKDGEYVDCVPLSPKSCLVAYSKGASIFHDYLAMDDEKLSVLISVEDKENQKSSVRWFYSSYFGMIEDCLTKICEIKISPIEIQVNDKQLLLDKERITLFTENSCYNLDISEATAPMAAIMFMSLEKTIIR